MFVPRHSPLSRRRDGGGGRDYNGGGSSSTPRTILACSAMQRNNHRDLIATTQGRRLLEDRRSVFDHLHPQRFAKNAIKIAMVQWTTILSNYYNDQLKEDMDREERVKRGDITRREANQEDEEWEEREWNKRMSTLKHRIAVAFAKYHAIVLVMRFYEYVASKTVSVETLDKWTIDTFECAKRESKTGKEGVTLISEMVPICFNANWIAFFADYSVHQVILLVGYYMYVRDKRRRIKERSGSEKAEEELPKKPLLLSFLRRSSLLAASRSLELGFSAVGGALGSAVWPGWGTLAGTNFGDSLGYQLLDEEEIESPSPNKQ